MESISSHDNRANMKFLPFGIASLFAYKEQKYEL